MDKIDVSFFVLSDSQKRLTFFTVFDLAQLFIWLVIIFAFAFYVRAKNKELDHYKYYFRNLLFKIFFGLVYALTYIFYYKGGDTLAYWELAGCMNKLFWQNPEFYFQELLADSTAPDYYGHYNAGTGSPPYWILREAEGFFVSKIVSFFTFFTGNSYLTITLIFSVIVARVNWRFYEMVRIVVPNHSKWLVYGVLFVPSVSFWCTGISKDAIVFVSILYVVSHFFLLINGKAKSKWRSILWMLFYGWLIYKVRSVILVTLFIPLLVAMSSRITSRFNEFTFFKRLVQFGIASVSIAVFFVGMQVYGDQVSVNKYLQEAEVTQKDFAQNSIYTGKKYSIGVEDYSPTGIFKAMPISVITGIFRPFLWEALSPTLLMNGLESTVLIYLFFRFFSRNFRERFQLIKSNDFLLFAFFFVILFAFITGFSSIIFGVLVRLRAPLLPFLMLLLLHSVKQSESRIEH